MKQFIEYMMSFYGTKGIYSDTIPGVTEEEIYKAVAHLAMAGHNFGGGDTVDREAARDVILAMRDPKALEEMVEPDRQGAKEKITKMDLAGLRINDREPKIVKRCRSCEEFTGKEENWTCPECGSTVPF